MPHYITLLFGRSSFLGARAWRGSQRRAAGGAERFATPFSRGGRLLALVERLDERGGVELAEIRHFFADAHEPHRDLEVVADAEDDPALGGAVELGEHDAGDPHGLLEDLSLRDGVLAVGGVEHQQGLVRRGGVELLHYATD